MQKWNIEGASAVTHSGPAQRSVAPPPVFRALPGLKRNLSPPGLRPGSVPTHPAFPTHTPSIVPIAFAGREPGSTLQPFVMSRQSASLGWIYCSSYDQNKIFSDKKSAEEYDREKSEEYYKKYTDPIAPITSRFPTLYSYTHIKTTNVMSIMTQGPHTFAFCNTTSGFNQLTNRDELKNFFYEDIRTPEDVVGTIRDEKKDNLSPIKSEIERYVLDYVSLYREIQKLFLDESSNLYKIRDCIRRIMELDPYATYGWKTRTKVSQKSIQGKGEKTGVASIDSRAKFLDKDAYAAYQKRRMDLYEKIPSKDIESVGPSDS